MRRSRIKYAPFVAGLLAGLLATLWFVFNFNPDSPQVQPYVPEAGMPSVGETPDFGEADPPRALTLSPPPQPADQPLVWLASSVETAGFPDERVRPRRPEAIPPDELYIQNRLILRHVRIDATSSGMQISGEVLTDFFRDRGPAWLPPGALLGFRISVELYQHDVVLARKSDDSPLPPHIDPRRTGTLVPGQSTDATIVTPRGEFATGPFAMPVLQKPLAPGVYSLVATLRFRVQHTSLQQAIKWCNDLYGARVEQDRDTLELTYRNVVTNVELHDEVYSFLMDDIGSITDRVRIHVGALVNGSTAQLIGLGAASPNILLEDLHCIIAAQARDYADQLDDVDALVEKELASKLKAEIPRDANNQERAKFNRQKETWKEQAEEDRRRIKRDNNALIQRIGGRLEQEEASMLERVEAARPKVLQQIADFQDKLTLNLWVLCDGVLQYTGWHAGYLPGYDACEAIQNGRLPGLRQALDPHAHERKWLMMKDRWKYVPPALSDAAFDYLRRKEETNEWHPREVVTMTDAGYRLDTTRWADWRKQWQADLDLALAYWRTVDTTRTYATQVWPRALGHLKAMHDEAELLPWSWEYYIRTEVQKESAAEVAADWPAEIAKSAATTPGIRKRAFDDARKKVTEAAPIADFMSRYSKAVRAGTKPPGED